MVMNFGVQLQVDWLHNLVTGTCCILLIETIVLVQLTQWLAVWHNHKGFATVACYS